MVAVSGLGDWCAYLCESDVSSQVAVSVNSVSGVDTVSASVDSVTGVHTCVSLHVVFEVAGSFDGGCVRTQ